MRDDRNSIRNRWRNFSIYHHIQTASGAHTFSYSVATEDSFPRDKAVETSVSAEVKSTRSLSPLSHKPLWNSD